MSKHWAKEQLHHDGLASGVDKTVSWVRRHRDFMGGAAITIAVLGLLTMYFLSRREKMREEAWDKYFQAQQLAYESKTDESFKLLDTLQKNFSRSEAAGYAALFKGDLLFELKKYPEAAQAYAALPQDPRLAPFAELGILQSKSAGGDTAGAVAAAQAFTAKYPDNPLTPQAYLTLARAYQAQGNTAASQETYKTLSSLFPESVWAGIAKTRILTGKK